MGRLGTWPSSSQLAIIRLECWSTFLPKRPRCIWMELKLEAARNYSWLPCSSKKKKKNTNISIWIYACLCLCTDRQYNKSPCRVTVSQGAPTRSYVTQNALRVNLNCTSNPCIDKELKKKKKNATTWIWWPSEIRKRNQKANTAENKTIF